jgi:hypothetical protein
MKFVACLEANEAGPSQCLLVGNGEGTNWVALYRIGLARLRKIALERAIS